MGEKRKRGMKTAGTKTIASVLVFDNLTNGTRKKRKEHMIVRQNGDDRDWAGLPDYLIEIVIEKLTLVDCLSFNSVCKGWKIVTNIFFEGRVIPLLVKPRQIGNITRTCLNVLGFKNNKNSTFDIRLPKKYIQSYIWGSYRDWLSLGRLLKKYLHISLLNPFSGEKVVLPKTSDNYHMIVLSSDPSDPRCTYMLVHQMLGVAFWTSDAPRKWRICKLMGSKRVVDALYHEGHFYLLNDMYEIVIIDEISVVKSMINNNTDAGIDESSIATQYLSLKAPCSRTAKKHIVQSNGEIILVSRIFHGGKDHEKTQGFETHRLDISQMAWIKLESLGNNNQVVFLGKSCSRSFNTKELGGGGGDDALANKIYFSNSSFVNRMNEWGNSSQILPERNDADDWGIFNLNKESSDWPRAFRADPKHFAGIWVMAPTWWCFKQMRLKRRR